MLTAFFAFFSGPWGLLLKFGAIVAVIGGIWLHGRSAGVDSMQAKYDSAMALAALFQQTAQTRKTQIDAQNQAVVALKAESDRRVKAMQERLKQANSEASQFREVAEKRKNAVLNLPLSENECTALKQLVDEARK